MLFSPWGDVVLKVYRVGESSFTYWLDRLERRGEVLESRVMEEVRDIIEDVKSRGDEALLEYTRKWDSFQVDSPRDLVIDRARMEKAFTSLPGDLRFALEKASDRIRRFHEAQKENSWFLYEGSGTILGQKVTPLERVGAYVPGGRASYPSSLLMNVIPARVAGVKEVVVCSPTPGGEVNEALLGAAYLAQVDRIYRVGGAQAVAAMAYGTGLIPSVDKIVGPGNVYVATAKKMAFGKVDIDMVAGPSEILVLADDTAPPSYVAADLLSQAEHDPLASAILITPSQTLAEEVVKEVESLLEGLATSTTARDSLANYGGAVVCSTLEEGIDLVNKLAPEHLEILTRDPWEVLPLVNHAGAIFLGVYSPEPMGDYMAGPNHVLPTGGRARFSSPLGTRDFVKYSSVVSLSREAFMELKEGVVTLAQWEGLPAHARAVKIRE
ncbi:MAG: histidinol dehydrogenase [Aquificota bacterium]|nr:MAG: histidinol dehydrogenase [Aquificota bacterium]